MNKYLIGCDDDMDNPAIVNAESEKEALEIYLNKIEIYDSFYEYVHGWGDEFGWKFFFYQDQPGQRAKTFDKSIAEKNVMEYFKDNPDFGKLFLKHWYDKKYLDSLPEDKPFLMRPFPEEMIRFLFIKEATEGDWTELKVISLGDLQEL